MEFEELSELIGGTSLCSMQLSEKVCYFINILKCNSFLFVKDLFLADDRCSFIC